MYRHSSRGKSRVLATRRVLSFRLLHAQLLMERVMEGKFTMKFAGYDKVPAHVAQQVIAEAKKERDLQE